MADLTTNLAGLKLANPTLTCSGTCGYAFEYADFMDLSKLGAFVTKSITREERPGNEPTRIVEVRAGMLNAIGLANVGLERFLAEKVPLLQKLPCPVIVNVAGHSFEDYVETCAAMNEVECIVGVELNVSCPNVKDGLTFGTHPGRLKELTQQVKKVLGKKRLIVKLSPNVEDITATARGAVEGGADILSMVNTFTAMAIDIWKRRPRLANVTGGLSGPAIKPIALQLVSRVYRNVAKGAGVPIIGMGGIQYWQDGWDSVLAGCGGVHFGGGVGGGRGDGVVCGPQYADCSMRGAQAVSGSNEGGAVVGPGGYASVSGGQGPGGGTLSVTVGGPRRDLGEPSQSRGGPRRVSGNLSWTTGFGEGRKG
ncbi:MAG TPA: dihydroorotate dehydrogenase [Tepidisphaeraceae bacterium]|nr:dihydroorotate dehydrogenase [Tepidisphaeraceae bacterium]